jgi:hypothetical protein
MSPFSSIVHFILQLKIFRSDEGFYQKLGPIGGPAQGAFIYTV